MLCHALTASIITTLSGWRCNQPTAPGDDGDIADDDAMAATAYAEYLTERCARNCSCVRDGKPCGPLCGCKGLCGNKLSPDFEKEGVCSTRTDPAVDDGEPIVADGEGNEEEEIVFAGAGAGEENDEGAGAGEEPEEPEVLDDEIDDDDNDDDDD